jgi:hypothetical protein
MKRMWINQPSTLQPFHKLHGARVLVEDPVVGFRRIWFTSGDVISMELPTMVLSEGWPQ